MHDRKNEPKNVTETQNRDITKGKIKYKYMKENHSNTLLMKVKIKSH